MIEKLKKYIWDNLIVTMALKPHNILCHRESQTEIFPVVCDNIGFAQRIPLVLYWPWFCHQKQKRLFQRFDHYMEKYLANLKKNTVTTSRSVSFALLALIAALDYQTVLRFCV